MRKIATLLLMLILALPLFCGIANVVDYAFYFNSNTMIFEEQCTGIFVVRDNVDSNMYMFVFLPYDKEFQESATEAEIIKAINKASRDNTFYFGSYKLSSGIPEDELYQLRRRGFSFVLDSETERFERMLNYYAKTEEDAIFTIASFNPITGYLIEDAFLIVIPNKDLKSIMKQINAK